MTTSGPTAPSGTYVIEGIETDPQGNRGRLFSPTPDEKMLEACAEETPSAE